MKLYTIYSPSHAVLLYEWLIPSVKDSFKEIITEKVTQTCSRASFYEQGWRETVLKKFNFLLKAIKENWGDIFVFSDVDIQFFNLDSSYIVSLLGEKDFLFQKNSANSNEICTGFFVCRANEKTKKLCERAIKEEKENMYWKGDQVIINYLLGNQKIYKLPIPMTARLKLIFDAFLKKQDSKLDINWDYLPKEFYLPGKMWNPGDDLDIPKDIVMHHANWTIGTENKIAQLEYVKDVVSKRSQI